MVPNSKREAPKPDPQNIRDLRLMYETAGRIDGIIEYERLIHSVMSSRDYHEGDITGMYLRVVPSSYSNLVTVCVQREQVTNLREDGVYSPKRLTDWSKVYTFQEFKESPFYQMCVDAWGNSSGLAWDTSKMDEHEVTDEDTRWYVYSHVYEHHRTWLGNWDKTGRIEAVDFFLDEDGEVEMGLTRNGQRESVYSGDIWALQQIVDEHKQMQEQLKKLKEHGIDLDDGTLSIKLWE